ncbi:MAG: hypothetical protein M0P49_00395 [Bacilli bacterium]|nr:hypothetical protein [Bacilli bacterium]
MMDYCLELSYDIFIADEMLEQAKLESFVNESLLIVEGTNTISNMQVIIESFGDKFKSVIKKIVNAIVNMWHKFLEGMNTLFKSDKGYLDKYKDTILKKQVRLGTLTMPNYEKGMKDLLNKKIPPFNYQSLKANLSNDKEQSSFRKSIYNDYKPDVEFPAFVKNKMQGGEKDITVNGSQLNMTNLFNFCYNFDKLAKGIENEINSINKVGNQAMSIIDEKVRNTVKTESSIYGTAKYFSNVYRAFIDEAVGFDGKTDNSKYNPSHTDGEHDTNDNTSQNLEGETAEEATENIKTYISVCGQLLAAKLTVARNCHKDYMSIIREHVRSYAGNKEASEDKANSKQKDVDTNTTDNPKKDKNIIQKGLETVKSFLS